MGTKKRIKKSPSIESFKSRALQFLINNQDKSFSLKQISRKLNFKNKVQREHLSIAIEILYEKGKVDINKDGTVELAKGKPGLLRHKKQGETYTGIVDHVNPRFAFIVVAELENDIKVSANRLANAWNGDTVEVAITKKAKKDQNPEGEVSQIIKRANTEFVGRLELNGDYGFVILDHRKLFNDVFIPAGKLRKAKTGEKVIVKIDDWPVQKKNAVGSVVKVLGEAGTNEVEMHSILLEFGLPYEFPEHIENEANAIPEEISPEEINKRRDFRNITTFTIDPVDAKDFDDALSIRAIDESKGLWEIGVHIADVTHYVRPGTKLEKEAYKRATSVYLVDRVVPMLPEKLSNNLCSLRPNEDKLAFSAVFEMTEDGHIHKQWFGRTVIHSDRRFAYEDAQEVLETKEGDYSKEILKLNQIAYQLRDKRFKNGAIKFETPEVRFQLDEHAKPIAVIPKIRKDAHKLIEDFMLLANKKVAEFVFNIDKNNPNTFVYRTHDDPDPEKLQKFANFAGTFGYRLKLDFKNIANEINELVDEIENKPEGTILQDIAVRAMSKAKYTTEPTGHFGLSFPFYTHFTSPIRRYPDMMVHRLLQRYLDQQKSADKKDHEEFCLHSSEREKMAADAERASIKYKQVEYMQEMKGRDFDGIVSGITEWGIYVEIIETKCEGMIRLSDLTDDTYEVDSDNYRIVGKYNGRIIKFGDLLRVEIEDTNLEKRTIDLTLVE